MSTKPLIVIPVVLDDEIKELAELRGAVRRVHKSVPAHSPVREASASLSEKLQQLHRRGVPLHTLAAIVGLSHQAVRVRVRSAGADGADASTFSNLGRAPKLTEPVPGVVLVADAGTHRRLHVFDPPEEAGSAYMAMIPAIPMLEDRDDILDWLETESDSPPQSTSITATRLRVPPAVYLPRAIVGTVLVPLTTEESRSGHVERKPGPPSAH